MTGINFGSVAALAGPMAGIDQGEMNSGMAKAIMNLAFNPLALKELKDKGTIPQDIKVELNKMCEKLNEENKQKQRTTGGRRSTRKSRKSKKSRKSRK